MPEIHLKQLEFIYIPCGPFAKNKKRIQKFMQTSDTNYITRMILKKLVFNMI